MSKFTDDQIAKIVETYQNSVDAGDDYDVRNEVMKNLGEDFGVSINAIRGVLVSNGIYVKKESTKQTSGSTSKKGDIVKAFEASFGVELKSMENMTKKDLESLWGRFVEMSDARNVELGQ